MDRYRRGFGLNLVDALRGRRQAWLADQLGVKPSTVSRWVNGHDHPTEENLEQIAAVLGVTMDALTGLTYQGEPAGRHERSVISHGSAAAKVESADPGLALVAKLATARHDIRILVQALLDEDPDLMKQLSPEFVESLKRTLSFL